MPTWWEDGMTPEEENAILAAEYKARDDIPAMCQALKDIVAERRHQIEDEGWTPEHDDRHVEGELPLAAACYAKSAGSYSDEARARWPHASKTISPLWPWDPKWWKPKTCRIDLVRAGALIVAEIERLDRAAAHVTTDV